MTKKKRKKTFFITFLVEFLFSCCLTFLFSFMNSHLRNLHLHTPIGAPVKVWTSSFNWISLSFHLSSGFFFSTSRISFSTWIPTSLYPPGNYLWILEPAPPTLYSTNLILLNWPFGSWINICILMHQQQYMYYWKNSFPMNPVAPCS